MPMQGRRAHCLVRIFLVFLVILGWCGSGNTLDLQREALLDFYEATNGPSWHNNTNWGFGDPCLNRWFGLACEDGDRVVSIL